MFQYMRFAGDNLVRVSQRTELGVLLQSMPVLLTGRPVLILGSRC